jgi:predicted RNA binding protein YcfA (HicA-like mRNA interferase family)
MPKLPVVTGNELIRALEKEGFVTVRQRGSHVRMEHEDGRAVTIPVHGNRAIGRGLLRKILRDAELTVEELVTLLD